MKSLDAPVDKEKSMSFFGSNKVETITKKDTLTTNKKKRIGILGGTFNPPHIGHLIMAEQVGRQLGLSKVLFMPTNVPPHKEAETLASGQERKAMIERAIIGNDLFEYEGIELEREGKSYTYDTVMLLKERYPEYEIYFIIGGDMVKDLPEWHKIDQLTKLVQFVGVKRPNYSTMSTQPVIWVDSPEVSVSSTELRKKIKTGCTVRYLIPNEVLGYIEQKGLYL